MAPAQAEIIGAKDEKLAKLRRKLEESEREKEAIRSGLLKLEGGERDAETRAMDAMDMLDERENVIGGLRKSLENKEREVGAMLKQMELMDKKLTSLKAQAASSDALSTQVTALSASLQDAKSHLATKSLELKQLQDAMRHTDNDRLDVAMEKEVMVRENAKSKKMAKGLEKMLGQMEARNTELVEELNRVREVSDKMNSSTSSDSNWTPTKQRQNSMKENILLSPTFTESLTKRHNSVLSELESMKGVLEGERASVTASSIDMAMRADNEDENLLLAFEQKNAILGVMEEHIDSLLVQLNKANGDLANKDELLNQMAEAIADYEEERENLQEELVQLNTFVSSAEDMVKREATLRGEAESEFINLQGEINNHHRKLLKNDSEWQIKFEAAHQICGGICAILGGAVHIKQAQTFAVTRAFFKWREVVSEVSVPAPVPVPAPDSAILDLERSNAHLRSCLEIAEQQTLEERKMLEEKEKVNFTLTQNSSEILESSRIMRSEMEKVSERSERALMKTRVRVQYLTDSRIRTFFARRRTYILVL